METRRYILAIGLSMVVLIVYMQFIAPQPPIELPPPAAGDWGACDPGNPKNRRRQKICGTQALIGGAFGHLSLPHCFSANSQRTVTLWNSTANK